MKAAFEEPIVQLIVMEMLHMANPYHLDLSVMLTSMQTSGAPYLAPASQLVDSTACNFALESCVG